ncbi:MAG: tripartite tricarboxylate transporter substrate binding protein [Burkholderiaceae bacterium]
MNIKPMLWAAAAVALLVGAGNASAQAAQGAAMPANWPDKPIHFITPYPPGGLSDQITRFVADRMSKSLGVPVIVDNKPGAGATLGTEFAARSAPDGYNFFVAPTATVAISPWLKKVNFTVDDFEPVAKLTSSYGLVTARKDAPFNTYKEFVAAAKASPGKYTFASNGVGSIVHLTAVLLHLQTGVNVVHVPYKGSVESMTDLMGGRIDLMYDPVTLPRVKNGELKGLATTNPERNPEIPDVPTLKEQGLDIDGRSWFGMFAPRNTSPQVIARMTQEARKAMEAPGVRQQLLLSAMYPDYEDPTVFGKRVRADNAYFKEVIQKEGIKSD